MSMPNATILNATHHAIGEYSVSGTTNQVPFCQVQATVKYGSDDTLNFALWLPDKSLYSSRFMAVGNGGFAGTINEADMLIELNNGLGLAVAGGDGGHQGASTGTPGARVPFLHDEDQVEAWAHNAISLFTPASRAVIKTYYSRGPRFSYFRGCSGGGQQAFSLAEFHSGLFDGIIA